MEKDVTFAVRCISASSSEYKARMVFTATYLMFDNMRYEMLEAGPTWTVLSDFNK
jgi:hypothetical protein